MAMMEWRDDVACSWRTTDPALRDDGSAFCDFGLSVDGLTLSAHGHARAASGMPPHEGARWF